MCRNHRVNAILRRVTIVALGSSLMTGSAQTLLHDEIRPSANDLAVLDSRSARRDLSCQIEAVKPILGFDLRFHSYYRVTIPQRISASSGGALSVLVRVRPTSQQQSAYFAQQVVMPNLPAEAKGMGTFAGGFDLGPGRYEVDWIMRDRAGRACSSHWEVQAKPGPHERTMALALGENAIAEGLANGSDEKPASSRVASQGLHLKILLNLSPVGEKESLLDPRYAHVLVSMLRSIVHESNVRHVSLIAFNLRAQKVIYMENADTVDFSALGKVLEHPDAGAIDYRLLRDRESEAHFVTDLLIDHLGRAASREDAIVILGPKVNLQRTVSRDLLKKGGAASCPIFYLNYAPNPSEEPFPDTIGSALKAYGTAARFEIVEPHDFGAAMKEMLVRLGR
jgi:hypothetical protein